MLFKPKFVYCLWTDEEMGTECKFTYTRPKQIPLFEEQDDGSLTQFKQDE